MKIYLQDWKRFGDLFYRDDIESDFVYPPIPDRSFDWSATLHSYEPGDRIGRGRTEVAAIADLLEQLMEDEPLPILKGERIYFKPEWQDRGDEGVLFIAAEDQEPCCNRIDVTSIIGFNWNPRQTVWLEYIARAEPIAPEAIIAEQDRRRVSP